MCMMFVDCVRDVYDVYDVYDVCVCVHNSR